MYYVPRYFKETSGGQGGMGSKLQIYATGSASVFEMVSMTARAIRMIDFMVNSNLQTR